MTWRSIKDDPPPKDRCILLICMSPSAPKHRKRFMAVDMWDEQYDGGFGSFNSQMWPATHWMPLPEPPDA